jgi:hypothetical protein
LNRQPQKGQGMQGHGRNNCTMNAREAFSGCGRRGWKRADGPNEDEGIGQSKLRRMGMMGGWMEVKIQLGTRVKLTIGSPLGVY